MGDLESHLTHDSLGPSEPITQMASRSVLSFLHNDHRVSLYFTMGRTFPPSKLLLTMGDLDPHLTHGSLGPPESSTQRASRSVQPFLQGSLVCQTDRQAGWFFYGPIAPPGQNAPSSECPPNVVPNSEFRTCPDPEFPNTLHSEFMNTPNVEFLNVSLCRAPMSYLAGVVRCATGTLQHVGACSEHAVLAAGA